MKKIFQKRVDKGFGDCMQAVVASLFNRELDEVPKFIELGQPMISFFKFFEELGYDPTMIVLNNPNSTLPTLKEMLTFDGGIDGYFYAVVNSQNYEDVTHAVIIDIDGKIVHDPNPDGKALLLTSEDIIRFLSVKEWWISNGKIIDNLDKL